MARPDLKNPKYDGWQAIDATPQVSKPLQPVVGVVVVVVVIYK